MGRKHELHLNYLRTKGVTHSKLHQISQTFGADEHRAARETQSFPCLSKVDWHVSV